MDDSQNGGLALPMEADATATKPPRPMLRRFGFALLKGLISLAIIGFLASRIDVAEVGSRLAHIALWSLVLALALAACQVTSLTMAWRLILERLGAALPVGTVFKASIISLFFNQVLPASLGGLGARTYFAYRAETGLAIATTSVVLERVAHFLTFLFVVILTQPLLFARVGQTVGSLTLLLTGGALLSGVVLMILGEWIVQLIPLKGSRILGSLERFSAGARTVFLWRAGILRLLAWSLLWHVFSFGILFVLARGLAIGINPLDFLAVLPPALLVGILPISINGWGVREAAMVGFLSLIDVAAADALALSVGFGIVTLLSRLPGAAVWLLDRDVRK